MSIIYIDNNSLVTLTALTNCATGAVDTTATVTVTLKDSAGVDVPGQTWPATMAHVSGGTYRATLDADLELAADHIYMAHVDAVGSTGQVGHFEHRVTARARKIC